MEEVATMPSNAQEFCLRWNNFHSSLISALDGFKNDLDFVDVTLACEGQFLKAHKMLLSACSVFFRDLLKANPCQHPIVILPPEVRFIDLEKMLRFIYQGEVNVHQENLARFLKTAEMLKIRGLAEDNEKQKVLQASSPRPSESNGADRLNDSSSPKRPRLSIDAQSGSLTDHPPTPGDDRLSGADSDSEMIPVKQEMIELKECDFESADNETFLAENYLQESSSATSSNNNSSSTQPQTHPAAPPPPGPLLPSYVPPPQVKAQDGLSRSSSHPVGGLIRRFLEECLQLPDPAPLLSTYSGLEGTPHFQLLRSVAKEWSYCRNATQNYSTLGGSNKRQRATSRLIETFENIDTLRNELAQLLHGIIIIEITMSGTIKKICKAEQNYVQQQQAQLNQQAQQGSNGENPANIDVVNREFVIMDIEGVSAAQQEEFKKATEVMKQLRKLYFDQSRRLAVRISQLKKGRQQSHERMQRQQHHLQHNYIQQTLQQIQQQQQTSQQSQQQTSQSQQQQQTSQQHQQHGQQQQQQQQQQHHHHHHHQQQQMQHQMQAQHPQMSPDGVMQLSHHSQLSLHQLHQPWSD